MKAPLRLFLLVPALALFGFAPTPTPVVGSHTWDFSEAFSNSDGQIQFLELKECCGGAGETGLPGHQLTSGTRNWTIPGPALTAPTSNKFFLIATAGFAALPGAPTPDRIIPAGNVPFFTAPSDSVSYVPWDTWSFSTVPYDGVNSLKRDGSISANTPTNYAGSTGFVVAGSGVPAMPKGAMVVLVIAALALGSTLLTRRPVV